MATSGELLYRLAKSLDSNDSFLSTNSSDKNESEDGFDLKKFLRDHSYLLNKIDNLRKQQQLIRAFYESKLSHIRDEVIDIVQTRRESIQLELKLLKQRVQSELSKEVGMFESQLIQSILKYSHVLQEDVQSAIAKLNQERDDKDAMKLQAKVHRDILIFNFHLRVESRQKIELVLLARESAQYQRCVKAVLENMNNHFGMTKSFSKLTADNLRVLNIFKLKNSFLSQALQKASNKSKGSKLKGLFCCIPNENIYDFIVHGIAKQLLPDGLNVPSLLSEEVIFHTPWYFAIDPTFLPANTEFHELHRLRDTARRKCREVRPSIPIRFSRYSTISTAFSSSKEVEVEKAGVFLALCRVLITRQKSINGYIDNQTIIDAAIQGYDAVYSSLSEEYILLQPALVLPEFLIHVHFNLTNLTIAATETNTTSNKTNANNDDFNDVMNLLTLSSIEQSNQLFNSAEDVFLHNQYQMIAKKLLENYQKEQQDQIRNKNNSNNNNNIDSIHGSNSNELLMESSRSRSNSPRKKMNNNDQQNNSNNPQTGMIIKQSALLSIERAVEDFRVFKRKLLVRSYRELEEYLQTMQSEVNSLY